MNQVQQLVAQVLSVVLGVWRHRAWALIVAWALCLSGWTYVILLPDQYRAEASVYVDTNSMLEPLLGGLTIDTNVGDQVRLMTQTLLSRPNLEKLARMTDLHLSAQTEAENESLISRLRQRISLVRSRQDDIYHISYESSDSLLAKRIVQTLLDIFISDTLIEEKQDVKSVQDFLSEQIREYEQKLYDAEERMQEFKRKNVGLMPGEGGGYYVRLQEAQIQLASAQAELRIAEERKVELQRQLRGEEPTFGIVASNTQQTMTPFDERVQALQGKLDELLLIYTEEHPDVLAIRQTIAKVEEERAQFVKADSRSGSVNTPLEMNPVYQRMRIAFGEATAEVNTLRATVAEHKAKVKELAQLMNTIPQVEAELQRLNRDYETNRGRYEALLERRETARLSEQVGKSADKVKFRVIEPPHVSPEPTGPDRYLFSTVVLVFGAGAGIAMGAFLAIIRPVIDSVHTLRHASRVPILGSVAFVPGIPGAKNGRMGVVSVFFFGIGLIGIYAMLIMAYQLDIDLGQKIMLFKSQLL